MDYIRKEDAINAMEEAINNKTWSMSDRDVIESMEEYVEALPIADVAGVKHGKWDDGKFIKIGGLANAYPSVQCSECGSIFCDVINNHKFMFHFCPYCGAKMDK